MFSASMPICYLTKLVIVKFRRPHLKQKNSHVYFFFYLVTVSGYQRAIDIILASLQKRAKSWKAQAGNK